MHAGANFADANIGGHADFANATAHGDVSFRHTTFGRGEYRGVKDVGTADFADAQIPHIVLGDGSRTEAADTSLLIVNPDTRHQTPDNSGTRHSGDDMTCPLPAAQRRRAHGEFRVSTGDVPATAAVDDLAAAYVGQRTGAVLLSLRRPGPAPRTRGPSPLRPASA